MDEDGTKNTLTREERLDGLTRGYKNAFERRERSKALPSDPLQFHLYHLALNWRHLIRMSGEFGAENLIEETFISTYIELCSELVNELIEPDSPLYPLWQNYWHLTQIVLHTRPVEIEDVGRLARV